MDEKEGPYKLVRNLPDAKDAPVYSVVIQEKEMRPFLQTIIPNAGSGENARLICNLLNKHYKEKLDEEDRADGDDGEGLPG